MRAVASPDKFSTHPEAIWNTSSSCECVSGNATNHKVWSLFIPQLMPWFCCAFAGSSDTTFSLFYFTVTKTVERRPSILHSQIIFLFGEFLGSLGDTPVDLYPRAGVISPRCDIEGRRTSNITPTILSQVTGFSLPRRFHCRRDMHTDLLRSEVRFGSFRPSAWTHPACTR
jgi:hypothetical protein